MSRVSYNPGDILYVRETWAFQRCIECINQLEDESCMDGKTSTIYEDNNAESEGCYIYRADHPHPERITWYPSIHMPKKAARIWIRVTNVSAKRLQDMNGQDILREGVNCHVHPEAHYFDGNQKMMFAELWDSTIKKTELDRYGWDANPMVWVIEFERCRKPE